MGEVDIAVADLLGLLFPHPQRSVGLNRRHGDLPCPGPLEQPGKPEAKHQGNQHHREAEVQVRPDLLAGDLPHKPPHGDNDDQVAQRDQKRESRHPGELGDLDVDGLLVQRHSETVPAEAAKEPAAHPFLRHPSRRAEQGDADILSGIKEIPLGYEDANGPAPKGEEQGKIKRNGKPADYVNGDQP